MAKVNPIAEITYVSGDYEIGSKIIANIFVKGVSIPISIAQVLLTINGNRSLSISSIKKSPFSSAELKDRGTVYLENKNDAGEYIPIEWDESGFLMQIEFIRVRISEFGQHFVVRIKDIAMTESPDHYVIHITSNAEIMFPPRD